MVIVVLWNVDTGDAWYHLPLGNLGNSVRFQRENRFDAEAAERLVWLSRIEHASRTMLHYTTMIVRGLADHRALRDHTLLAGTVYSISLLEELASRGVCKVESGETSPALAAVAQFIALTVETFWSTPEVRALFADETKSQAAMALLVEEFARALRNRPEGGAMPGMSVEELVFRVAGDLASATVRRKFTADPLLTWAMDWHRLALVSVGLPAVRLAIQWIDRLLTKRGVDVAELPQ